MNWLHLKKEPRLCCSAPVEIGTPPLIFSVNHHSLGIFTKLSKLVKVEDSASAVPPTVATAGSDSGISGTSSPPSSRPKSPPVPAPRTLSTSSDDKTPTKATGKAGRRLYLSFKLDTAQHFAIEKVVAVTSILILLPLHVLFLPLPHPFPLA